jgi:hypothetical protein
MIGSDIRHPIGGSDDITTAAAPPSERSLSTLQLQAATRTTSPLTFPPGKTAGTSARYLTGFASPPFHTKAVMSSAIADPLDAITCTSF